MDKLDLILQKLEVLEIDQRIVKLRERKGWSQRELAKRAGLNPSVMNRIETGERPVKDKEIIIFSDLLEVSTDYLLGRTDNPNLSVNENKPFDPLSEINKLIKEYGIEQFGFFDIEKWKNLSPEDIEEIRRHFEWVAHKAKERDK